MCKVKHATSPFRATWLRQLHVSPLSYKMLMLKFVISVLKLEEVTENLLSKLLPLDQLNPVHLSWSLLFILLSVLNLGKKDKCISDEFHKHPWKLLQTKLTENYTNKNNCCGATVESKQQHNQDLREIYKGERILEFITFYHNALH